MAIRWQHRSARNIKMPKKLAWQIISLILFMVLSTHILIFFFFFVKTDFHEELENRIDNGTYINQMASAVNVIENSPFRDSFSLSSFRVKFFVVNTPLFDGMGLTDKDLVVSRSLQEKMGDKYPNAAMQQLYAPQSRIAAALNHFFAHLERLSKGEPGSYSPSVILQSQVQLNNGQWVAMLVLDIYPYPNWIVDTLSPLLAFTGLFILFSIVIVLGITSPLAELAKKADKLGIGEKINEVKLRGPSDVQNVIIAFNNMLKRVTNVNDHRARALSAISHDIRTPLTSMRLQAEFIREKDIQDNIFRKIDEMEQICEATITFALQDSWAEKTREFDIVSFVDSLCADLSEQGLDVTFDLTQRIKFSGRPIALKRAITNLINNGVEYGKRVEVSIEESTDFIEIHIVDNGQGIPSDKMELLFAPFERLEDSRNRESGGLGLGMAIARSVVRSHGGEIELVNTENKGLDAIVVLPRSPSLID